MIFWLSLDNFVLNNSNFLCTKTKTCTSVVHINIIVPKNLNNLFMENKLPIVRRTSECLYKVDTQHSEVRR